VWSCVLVLALMLGKVLYCNRFLFALHLDDLSKLCAHKMDFCYFALIYPSVVYLEQLLHAYE